MLAAGIGVLLLLLLLLVRVVIAVCIGTRVLTGLCMQQERAVDSSIYYSWVNGKSSVVVGVVV
jgi:hypothetical protein